MVCDIDQVQRGGVDKVLIARDPANVVVARDQQSMVHRLVLEQPLGQCHIEVDLLRIQGARCRAPAVIGAVDTGCCPQQVRQRLHRHGCRVESALRPAPSQRLHHGNAVAGLRCRQCLAVFGVAHRRGRLEVSDQIERQLGQGTHGNSSSRLGTGCNGTTRAKRRPRRYPAEARAGWSRHPSD